MTGELCLVRHGRTEGSDEGRLLGVSDRPIDAVGRQQALALRELVTARPGARVLSSPLLRARQTAALACGVPEASIAVDPALQELDFGSCEGLTFAEVSEAYPEVARRWAAGDPDIAFPGGERLSAFFARVAACARRLTAGEASAVIAFSHAGVIRTLLCELLGFARERMWAFDIDHGSVARLRIGDGWATLRELRPAPRSEGNR